MATDIAIKPIANTRIKTGWAIALASTLCFSLAPTLASAAIDLGITPTVLLFLRLTITTALLVLTILATKPALLRIDRKGLIVCLLGGLSNGIGMLAFFWSLTRIHSSIASMLFSVSPLVTLLLLALRGEKFTYRNTIRVALGLIGIYLLIGPGGQVDTIGVLLAAVSVFTVPFMTVLMQWYLSEHDPRPVTLYTVGAMALVVSVYWLWEGAPQPAITAQGWILIIALAVVTTYVARLLLVMGIQHIGSGQVGLLAPVETLLTVIWSVTFLSERLTPIQLVGGSLIILSAILAVRRLGRVNWRKR